MSERIVRATPEMIESSRYIKVAKITLKHIASYIQGEDLLHSEEDFLNRETIGMVDSAMKVLVHNPQAARNLGKIDDEAMHAFNLYKKAYFAEGSPDADDNEAFTRLMLGIGMVPEMAEASGLPERFYAPQELHPPFTAMEVLGRIYEVGRMVRDVAEDRLNMSEPLSKNFPFLRTIWTFQGIGSITLREDETISPELTKSLKLLKNRFVNEADR